MDKIFITDLRVETIIGIYDWERTTPQVVSIDLEMGFDISQAAATEDIEHTLNYKAVSKRVEQFIADSDFQLIETMAEKTAQLVLGEFAVDWLQLTVHKPGALSNSSDVGVRIVRSSS